MAKPKKTSTRKNRRSSRPNIFIQSDRPDASISSSETESSSSQEAPRVRASVQRTNQRASVRSEVFTRSIGAELRKLGALTGVIVVALVVLTVVL